MAFSQLVGVVPIDTGRVFSKFSDALLGCIARLANGSFDNTDEWLLSAMMEYRAGGSSRVTQALDAFTAGRSGGRPVDIHWLKALRYICGYGLNVNYEKGARELLKALKLGDLDDSGRCSSLLGFCREWHKPGDKHIAEAVQLYEQAMAQGSPSAACYLARLYLNGRGVPQDLDRAEQLLTRAHLLTYPDATFDLAKLLLKRGKGGLAAALFREAYAWGQQEAVKLLRGSRRPPPVTLIPYGCWQPVRHVHLWVTDQMHTYIFFVLLAHQRKHCVFNRLPRDVLMHVCAMLVSQPTRCNTTLEMLVQGASHRAAWRSRLLERRMDSIERKLDRVLSLLSK